MKLAGIFQRPQFAAAAAIASGIMLAPAFPDINFELLAWFALAPLLLATRGRRPRSAFGLGWLTGFVFYLWILYWIAPTISNFTRLSPLEARALAAALCALEACTFGFFAASLEWLGRGSGKRLLLAPALWVCFEWCRTFVVAGFPWASLGYSQYRLLHVIQIADLGSVYAVSAVLVLFNTALAEFVALTRERRAASRLLPLALLLVVPVAVTAYGSLRLKHFSEAEIEGSLPVAFVQGNISQRDKWDPRKQNLILNRYLSLSQEAVAAGARLVVWPEAALPFYLEGDPRSTALTSFSNESGAQLLTGAPAYESRGGEAPKPYNRAWQVVPGRGLVRHYDKIQLVPFGEYVPLSSLLSSVQIVVEAVGEFGRGEEYTIFDGPPIEAASAALPAASAAPAPAASSATLPATAASSLAILVPAAQIRAGPASAATVPDGFAPGLQPAAPLAPSGSRPVRFATLICYEGIFPALTRRFVLAGADFLVNISNDAWYGRTSAPYQHLSMVTFRAVENRVPVVRATNTGVSAFVYADGSTGVRTALFETDIGVERILLRRMDSLYRHVGDLFVYICLALTVLFALFSKLRGGSVGIDPRIDP